MDNKLLRIAPHSLALVLSQVGAGAGEGDAALPLDPQHRAAPSGYEVFASFKAVNSRHFWNAPLTRAVSAVLFLGWMDERVLLIQGAEAHLQVLRTGWTRRTLRPPQGFDIKEWANQFE
ncbi:putative storkhead-box protein 2 [Scophthalmus maximus]|uniref:Putative storkhead-box protein 2 n=1 Tax=Scophthalmus maximus TaxID=52904 RepID=A0A2U9BML4_SCOMX|nr:putative storkhead-box protein 2 [Scophthalmus maximus]